MKDITVARISFIVGLLLAMPAAFAMLADFLAYSCGVWFLFHSCFGIIKELGLHRWVLHHWSMITIYAPLTAFLINLPALIRIDERSSGGSRRRRIRLIKNRMNFSVIILGGLALFICLFFILI